MSKHRASFLEVATIALGMVGGLATAVGYVHSQFETSAHAQEFRQTLEARLVRIEAKLDALIEKISK